MKSSMPAFDRAVSAAAPERGFAVQRGVPIKDQVPVLNGVIGKAFLQNLRVLTDGNRFSSEVVARAKEYIDAGFDFHLNADRTLDSQLTPFGLLAGGAQREGFLPQPRRLHGPRPLRHQDLPPARPN